MNRRQLLQSLAVVAQSAPSRSLAQIAPKASAIRLSVATYSLRNFRRDLAIRMIRQMRIEYADVKEFHLPYNDSPRELAAGRKRFDDAGIRVIGGGNISMPESDEAGLRKHFDYARACGFPILIAAPTHGNLRAVEKLAREYNVRIAIHNHGPEDKQFPSPESVLEAVHDMDPCMGLCIDIGHSARAGSDVVKAIRAAGPRLFELHMKDLRNTGSSESACIVGEGILPIPRIFEALRAINYPGVCSLEYEVDEDNPLPGMQQSFAYMRGVIAAQEMGTASA